MNIAELREEFPRDQHLLVELDTAQLYLLLDVAEATENILKLAAEYGVSGESADEMVIAMTKARAALARLI